MTLPPYELKLNGLKSGDELKITVANTISNALNNTDFFKLQDIKNVGPYHDNMAKHEAYENSAAEISENIILEKAK